MPREGKTGITLNDETFEDLRDRKPDGVTWDWFLDKATQSWVEERGE